MSGPLIGPPGLHAMDHGWRLCSYLFVYSVNVSSVSNKQAALPQGRLPFFLTMLTVPWD